VSSLIFHPLEQAEQLFDGYLKAFHVEGCDLILVQQGGKPAILEGICPHAGHPFANSRIIGGELRCDMHGNLFDVRTGLCTRYTEGPCRSLRVYAYAVREGVIGVLLP
jgi:nitrite reductase/ring-hydroxylating ferredoxin subunit